MLLRQFKEHISRNYPLLAGEKLLLAVSGGVDSVVLCELCYQAGFTFTIAHCNFMLRGAESDRDEAFVKSLEERYATAVLVKHFDTAAFAEVNKLSVQVAARELRYRWFAQIMADPAAGFRYLFTAHHADDNIETLLMNFFKGTGIQGLKGIAARQGYLVRPLLFAAKKQLLEFATEKQLNWVDDSSNESDKYTRNYFRNQLIPGLQKVYPQVLDNLQDNLLRFGDVELLYRASLDRILTSLLEIKGTECHIPVLKLQKTLAVRTVLYEVIKNYGFTPAQTDDALGLLNSETGRYVASATHRILKNRQWLIISPLQPEMAQHILLEEGIAEIVCANGKITLHKQNAAGYQLKTEAAFAQFDAAAVHFPLLLRRWKKGDYFYPLGMAKKKKLSRFFTDQKLSLTQKEQVWVLEMDKKIIWVAGMRIDDRVKLKPSAAEVLVLEWQPAPF